VNHSASEVSSLVRIIRLILSAGSLFIYDMYVICELNRSEVEVQDIRMMIVDDIDEIL
jgi:hypothetical protein